MSQDVSASIGRNRMDEKSPSPALFFDTISAYERTEALRAAIELDIRQQWAVRCSVTAML
jgi:hypothetical protein